MNSIKEEVTLKTGADFLAEGWQHVAYYDDGEFHWMYGHSPRNCELYTPVQSTSDLRAKAEGLAAEVASLRSRLVAEREENLWNAYHTGHEKDGKWGHSFMSDGEWLAGECGYDPRKGYYEAAEIKARIPVAAKKALTEWDQSQ